jgi:hypothetical protein
MMALSGLLPLVFALLCAAASLPPVQGLQLDNNANNKQAYYCAAEEKAQAEGPESHESREIHESCEGHESHESPGSPESPESPGSPESHETRESPVSRESPESPESPSKSLPRTESCATFNEVGSETPPR